MATKFKAIGSGTGIEAGQVYTADELNKLPGMGGVERLLQLKTVVPVEIKVDPDAPTNPAPQPPPKPIPAEGEGDGKAKAPAGKGKEK